MLRQLPASFQSLSRQVENKLKPWRFVQVLSGQDGTARHDYSVAESEKRSGTLVASVAVIGAPNAGKSSLMNALIRNRIAAVSRKVNTTRSRTVGAYTEGSRQLLFWDTPGVVERQFVKGLGPERREISTGGWGAAADADVAVLVVDASKGLQYWKKCASIAGQLAQIRRSTQAARDGEEGSAEKERDTEGSAGLILVLNKCDITRPRTRLLEAAEFFRCGIKDFATSFEDSIFMVSAYNGRGVGDLRKALLDKTNPGNFEVEPGVAHDEDDLDLIREHLWEKLLHCVHREVPYLCRFESDGLIELPNGDVHASEIIRVPQARLVPIVIGPGGRTVKWIRDTAMVSASQALGRQVHLKLRVKAA